MDKDIVSESLEEFAQAEDHWGETRNRVLEDLKFCRLGEQWEDGVVRARQKAGRPVLTRNMCPAFARQVVNDARQNKPSIKVHPSDDHADPETAEVMNGLIRNIEYTSDAEVAYDTALESAVYGGWGFFRIALDYASYDQFDMDIKIERISNPLSVYPDIGSTECDASDWNTCFVTEMMLRDEFKNKYPDADPVDFKGDYDEDWRTEDDVRIAERWKREEVDAELVKLTDGTTLLGDDYLEKKDLFDSVGLVVVQTRPTKTFNVTQQIITCADVLEETEWSGRYIPICPVYGEEFVVEGKRYFLSMFYHAKDPQRMSNYWRTTTTELVALAPRSPFVGAKGQFKSDKNWASANKENHPYLEYDAVDGMPPPRREAPPQIPEGALQEAINADMDMKSIIGIHDPGMGKNPAYQMSGKAIHEWKVNSDISNFHFIDNFSRGLRYAGRVLLDLIPQVYNEPRVLRVMGYDGEVENVPVQQEIQKGGTIKMHDFSKGKYDLTVETGPSFSTRRQEATQTMMEFVKSAPELSNIIGDLIAKNQDWEGADEMARRLKAMLPPQILALEELDDMPEEARVIVGAAQAEVQKLQQIIEQGKAMLAERDQIIQYQGQQLNDKSEDNQIKRDKLDNDIMITKMKEVGDQKLATIKAEYDQQLAYLKGEIDRLTRLTIQ